MGGIQDETDNAGKYSVGDVVGAGPYPSLEQSDGDFSYSTLRMMNFFVLLLRPLRIQTYSMPANDGRMTCPAYATFESNPSISCSISVQCMKYSLVS